LQLSHYIVDIPQSFQNITTLFEFCKKLVEFGKPKRYHLIDRLIRLVLILQVSTATIERAFSSMKNLKTRQRNKMSDDLLSNSFVIYNEKYIAS